MSKDFKISINKDRKVVRVPRSIVAEDKIVYGVSLMHPHIKRKPVHIEAKHVATPKGILPVIKPVVSINAKTLVEPKKVVAAPAPKLPTAVVELKTPVVTQPKVEDKNVSQPPSK